MEDLTGRKMSYQYVDENRRGDHICYISDLRKFKAHFPAWTQQYSLADIAGQLVEAEYART